MRKLWVIFGVVMGFQAFAQDSEVLTMKLVEISGEEGTLEVPKTRVKAQDPEQTPILDQIVNIGKKIWAVVESNKPVVHVELNRANALPKNLGHWSTLQNWAMPETRVYQVTYTNGFGVEVVDFKFRVLFLYGGNYRGKGKYLTNVSVFPEKLNVAWAYTFNAQVIVPEVVNLGSSEDPVAGINMQLAWSVDTVLKHSQSTATFFVTGDGKLVQMGVQQLELTKGAAENRTFTKPELVQWLSLSQR